MNISESLPSSVPEERTLGDLTLEDVAIDEEGIVALSLPPPVSDKVERPIVSRMEAWETMPSSPDSNSSGASLEPLQPKVETVEVEEKAASEEAPKKKNRPFKGVFRTSVATIASVLMLLVTVGAGYLGSKLTTMPKKVDGKEELYNNFVLTGYFAMLLCLFLIPLSFATLVVKFVVRRNRKVGVKQYFSKYLTLLDKKKIPRWRFLMGSLSLGTMLFATNILYNASFEFLPVSIAICSFYSSTVFVFLLGTILLRERVDILRNAVILLIVGGLISLSMGGNGSGEETPKGNPLFGLALSVGSAITFSFNVMSYSIFFPTGTAYDKLTAMGFSGLWITFLGVPVLLLAHFSGFQSMNGLTIEHIGLSIATSSGLLFYNSLFAIALSFGHPGFILILNLLSIPLSGLLDFAFKGQIFPPSTYVGFALILLGSFFQTLLEVSGIFCFPVQLYLKFQYQGREIEKFKQLGSLIKALLLYKVLGLKEKKPQKEVNPEDPEPVEESTPVDVISPVYDAPPMDSVQVILSTRDHTKE